MKNIIFVNKMSKYLLKVLTTKGLRMFMKCKFLGVWDVVKPDYIALTSA